MVGVLNGKAKARKAFVGGFVVAFLLCGVFGGLVVKQSLAYTGTITYSAGTDTITCVGGSAGTPIGFGDLYAADVAGGWSQVTNQGNQYVFNCKIVVGNGSATYFNDSDKVVEISTLAINGSDQKFLTVSSGAYLQLGNVYDYVTKSTYGGCCFHGRVTSYWYYCIYSLTVNSRLFSCRFSSDGSDKMIIVAETVWNVEKLNAGVSDIRAYANGADFYGVKSLRCSYGVMAAYTGTWSRLEAVSCGTAATRLANVNATVSDVYARNNSKVAGVYSATNKSFNFVDFDSDSWGFTWSSCTNVTVYRRYTFDLYVLNGDLTDYVENANVSLSHDGAVVGSWLTNSSGQVETQTLTYGYYNSTGGDTLYGGTAWTLTITHPDWRTYESSFYPYSEIDWSVSMQEGSNGGFGLGLLLGVPLAVVGFAGGVLMFNRRR